MKVTINNKTVNLPDFFIVGTARSGTTSLWNYLKQNKRIYLGRIKEPKYFAYKDDLPDKSLDFHIVNSTDKYIDLFKDARKKQLIGEASVLYLFKYKAVIENIKEIYGEKVEDIKIIIMLRDPVSRAYSMYNHHRENLKRSISFKEAIKQEINSKKEIKNPFFKYIKFGQYYNQVKAYEENFSNVKEIFFEDFKKNTEETIKEISDFLEVNYQKINNKVYNESKVYNEKLTKLKPLYRWFIRRNNFLRKIVRKTLPYSFRAKIDKKIRDFFLTKNYRRLDNNLRKKMKRKFFHKDIKKLKELLPDKKEKIDRWLEE